MSDDPPVTSPRLAEQWYFKGVREERKRVLDGLSYLSDLIAESAETEGREQATIGIRAVRQMQHYVTEGKAPPSPDDLTM